MRIGQAEKKKKELRDNEKTKRIRGEKGTEKLAIQFSKRTYTYIKGGEAKNPALERKKNGKKSNFGGKNREK